MRITVEDKSSRPNKTRQTFTEEQMDQVIFERKHNKRSIEEIAEVFGTYVMKIWQ